MDRLVGAGAEERGAQDALRSLLDVDLEEAAGFALFRRARDPGHAPLADQSLDAFVPYFLLREPDAAERRVGVERVRGQPGCVLAAGVREPGVGDDLVVVVRGVGKGALAVAISERPDVRVGGPQAFIDLDV